MRAASGAGVPVHRSRRLVARLEEVGEPSQGLWRETVDAAIGRVRTDVRQPMPLRILEQRTEAVETEGAHRVRRLQMSQQGDQARHPLIFLRGLTGQTPDEVPDDVQTCLARPLEKLYAAQRRRAFAHQREDRRAQAFDAHLKTDDARTHEARQLLSGEVGPGLQVHEARVGGEPLQVGEELIEVARREDLVGDEHRARRVPPCELLELPERAGAGLDAVRHRFAGLTAEGAPALLAPPAPARGLEGDARREGIVQRARRQSGEVVVVVGHGQPVQVRQRGGIGRRVRCRRRRASRLAVSRPGKPASGSPASRRRTSAGSTASPSPTATASTNGKQRRSSAPISPRQLAPPKTTVVSGRASLRRAARASEAAC